MKKIVVLLATIILISCSKSSDFSQIKVGMKASEVVELVGEPKTKTETGIAGSWWAYETHLVVIQADTVNECSTNEDVKKRMQEVSEGLENMSDSLKSE